MKRVIAVVVLVGLIAAAVVYYPRLKTAEAPATELRLSGNVETHESVVSFKVAGRIAELGVEEGQWVEEGAVIARLDDAEFQQQVALDESTVRVRERSLALAEAGSRRQEIEAAQQTVLEAKAELEQRQLDLERAERLLARDVISTEQRDLAATALRRARAAYDRAGERLDQAREGARAEEIAIARAQVEQVREALKMSSIRLGHTVLRAPRSGVVLVRQVELGEVVAPGTPVVTLGELDRVWVRAFVNQADLGRIRWGQAARVRTDTFPEKDYVGRISFIAAKAEFTPKTVETHKERVTLVFRIKVDVENSHHELKPGMPADVYLGIEESPAQARLQRD